MATRVDWRPHRLEVVADDEQGAAGGDGIEQVGDATTIRCSWDRRGVANLLDSVAPGGTLLVVSHDLEPMRAPIDSRRHSRPFDPDAYVRVEDFVAVLADSPAWRIEVNEKRPRPPGAASAAHHVDDVVLRARRLPD